MRIKTNPVKLIIGIFLFVIFFHPLIYRLIWPDCFYESSDGNWWDNEVGIKGRGFDDMVTLFELYKLRCDVPTVKLVRTTRKNPLNVLAWHNYLTDEKWKIEYGVPSSKSESSSSIVALRDHLAGKHPCSMSPKVEFIYDVRMAHRTAQKYIESLSSVKQPSLFAK
jgi:hypothetical protein